MGNPHFITESDIRRAITTALEKIGVIVWKTSNNQKSANTKGMPDLIVNISKQVCIGLEVKTPTGRVTEEQQDLYNNKRIYIVRSVDEAVSVVEEMRGKLRNMEMIIKIQEKQLNKYGDLYD